jgi:hypothetical protein
MITGSSVLGEDGGRGTPVVGIVGPGVGLVGSAPVGSGVITVLPSLSWSKTACSLQPAANTVVSANAPSSALIGSAVLVRRVDAKVSAEKARRIVAKGAARSALI